MFVFMTLLSMISLLATPSQDSQSLTKTVLQASNWSQSGMSSDKQPKRQRTTPLQAGDKGSIQQGLKNLEVARKRESALLTGIIASCQICKLHKFTALVRQALQN